jgi:hypothetical protein
MPSGLRSHVRHNVVGYVALFFALSGTALGANAAINVGDPARGDLTGTYPNPAIAAGKVDSAKVADQSLTGADIDESTLGTVGDADTLDGLDATGLGAGAVMGQAHCTVCAGLGAHTFSVAPSGSSELDPSLPNGTELERASELTPNVALRARDLVVRFSGSVSSADSRATFALLVDGAPTTLACTIAFSSGFRCDSGDAAAVIPAGSAVALSVATDAGVSNLRAVAFGWRLVGPV